MAATDNRGVVLATLRISSQPLDDDQLAARTGVQPRQQVNQICRALERAGLVRRYVGPDGKIVNQFVGTVDTDHSATTSPAGGSEANAGQTLVHRAADHAIPPGSSQEQQDAERVMLDLLGGTLGLTLEPATITIPSGARVEIDGADMDRTVLVECWAHQGPPKSAQRHKVLADAFKLTWISHTIYPRPRLILCLSDPAAAAPFLPSAKSWAAQALHDLDIGIRLVTLPDAIRQRLRQAQERQYR